MNKSIPKWVFLSTAKHFTDGITDITTFVEGAEERDLSGQNSWIEIRINGPDMREISKDVLVIENRVNLLVATHFQPTAPAEHINNIGLAVENFTDYCIYKYGSADSDDRSSYGMMKLLPLNGNEKLEIVNMGQIDPNINLLQATVEGHFKMLIGV